jgi:protein-L-isoaspartate(D-aspartate) O-methyltransferase
MDRPGNRGNHHPDDSGLLYFPVISDGLKPGVTMDFAAERARLIGHLDSEISDRRVLDAMGRIPRERFIPESQQSLAYLDEPLPIGHNQTISQPFIVAMMTQALELEGGERVLEIGTGSGYQTAILAELCREVVTIERISSLSDSAQKVLDSLGYKNIRFQPAGQELGWPAGAPYDGIIVTAGSPRIPESLIEQLAVGGRLVIPVGSRFTQQLYQLTKKPDRNIIRDLGGCRFVPLISEDAWTEST